MNQSKEETHERDLWRYFHPAAGRAARLIVIAHGFRGSLDKMGPVLDAARSADPAADIYLPLLAIGGPRSPFMRAEPAEVARALLEDIDLIWNARQGGYEGVVLVGYSAGSLIVRKVAIYANGELDVPFEGTIAQGSGVAARPWAHRIERVVLLAGLARGWSVSSALDWKSSVVWSAGNLVAETIGCGKSFLLAIRAGSPFIVQTRLQWLCLARRGLAPRVVQLLGTIDDLVSPEDNLDLLVDNPGDRFLILEVPSTGHSSIIEMARPGQGDEVAAGRWSIFSRALCSSPQDLRQEAICPEHLADSLPPPPDESVTDVVFVIHGIRDRGFWTQKVARQIKRAAALGGPQGRRADPHREKQVICSMTASYGYFPMAPFLLPWVRARKVGWLMDRYTDARARFPNARFSYVGHSNGSYLVAGALRHYPAARFNRIVLAGSVVRTDFPWKAYLAAGRVAGLLNYVATGDLVVAGFPKGFQRLGLFDLGGGGHDGFQDLVPASQAQLGAPALVSGGEIAGRPYFQIRYVRGGHGAGIKESQWDEIADFIVHGAPPVTANPDYQPSRPFWSDKLFAFQPVPLILGVLAVLVIIAASWLFFWPAGVLLTITLLIILNRY